MTPQTHGPDVRGRSVVFTVGDLRVDNPTSLRRKLFGRLAVAASSSLLGVGAIVAVASWSVTGWQDNTGSTTPLWRAPPSVLQVADLITTQTIVAPLVTANTVPVPTAITTRDTTSTSVSDVPRRAGTSSGRHPAPLDDGPSTTADGPSTTADRPGTTGDRPSTTGETPSSTRDAPRGRSGSTADRQSAGADSGNPSTPQGTATHQAAEPGDRRGNAGPSAPTAAATTLEVHDEAGSGQSGSGATDSTIRSAGRATSAPGSIRSTPRS